MTVQFFAQAYAGGVDSTIRFLCGKGLRYCEAEEVAQSAWARGWEARDQLRSEGSVLPWVNRIAFHQFCNEKRRLARLAELADMEEYPDTANAPARALARLEAGWLLAQCSELDHAMLVECYAEGQPMKDIGSVHGMSTGAVRVRLHRARKTMRSLAA